MSMTDIFRSLGRSDALKLREEAHALTGTQIIDREFCIPAFDPTKDYSTFPVGAPVADENQVWLLIQPHNASHYSGRPATLRALWGLAHTTNAAKAKARVDPYGTSGMYMLDECCTFDGRTWRCIHDDNPYSPADYAQWWEEVIL